MATSLDEYTERTVYWYNSQACGYVGTSSLRSAVGNGTDARSCRAFVYYRQRHRYRLPHRLPHGLPQQPPLRSHHRLVFVAGLAYAPI